MKSLKAFLFQRQVDLYGFLNNSFMFCFEGKSPERSYSPTMRHTAHILKSQQSLASEILAWTIWCKKSDFEHIYE